MEESKMESFHRIQNLSVTTMLGLGMMVSAHAVEPTVITEANCGVPIMASNTTFVLEGSITCDGVGFALQFTGTNNKFFLQGNSVIADNNNPPALGIYITNDSNHVTRGQAQLKGLMTIIF